MVLDPYRASDEQINAVWETMNWEMPTGYCQFYRLPSKWEPYEEIRLSTEEYHVFLSTEDWHVVSFGETSEMEDFLIEPPSLAVFSRGHGESPSEIISSGRDAAESVSGVISLVLGSGYPVLLKVYEAVFRKDNPETIKYYPARSRVGVKGLLRSDMVDALDPVSQDSGGGLPEHIKLAFRWYGKGISEEHPVDQFIALYECCLAVVTRWHYTQHPQEYETGDAPLRKIFRDWVHDVMEAVDQNEEDEYFEPFNKIVGTRNLIFKANVLAASQEDIEHAVTCAKRVLNWSLVVLRPETPGGK